VGGKVFNFDGFLIYHQPANNLLTITKIDPGQQIVFLKEYFSQINNFQKTGLYFIKVLEGLLI